MYSLLRADDEEKKTAKGISRNYQQMNIRHKNYKACLDKNFSVIQPVETTNILSRDHNVYTVKQTKKGLSPFNDKKYFCSDGKSFSFGHRSIKKNN